MADFLFAVGSWASHKASHKARRLRRKLGFPELGMPWRGTQRCHSATYAFARTPPVSGLATPVVPGNVMGRPLSERTAR